MWIVAYGGIADGYVFVGPFATSEEAIRYAEGDSDPRGWTVMVLEAPPDGCTSLLIDVKAGRS